MSIFRKVASAFVEFDGQKPGSENLPDATDDASSLDDIGKDAGGLLAQLEGTKAAAAAPGDAAAPARPDAPLMLLTAEDVFAKEGLVDGPNSSRRILKMLAGLSAFPPPQQLAMVRALDAADDTWSEPEVQADARERQNTLRRHLQAVDAERTRQLGSIARRAQQASTDSQTTLAEIDRQIAELQKLRQDALAEVANTLAALEAEKTRVEQTADVAQRGINQVIAGLGTLINFFSSGGATPPSR